MRIYIRTAEKTLIKDFFFLHHLLLVSVWDCDSAQLACADADCSFCQEKRELIFCFHSIVLIDARC